MDINATNFDALNFVPVPGRTWPGSGAHQMGCLALETGDVIEISTGHYHIITEFDETKVGTDGVHMRREWSVSPNESYTFMANDGYVYTVTRGPIHCE